MKPEQMLALRYFKSRKRNRLLSFLTITSVVGIMLGVATLIVVVSVMSGFSDNLKSKLLGANSDIVVNKFDSTPIDDYDNLTRKTLGIEGVAAVSPFILGQALLTSDKGVTGVVVRGIDTEREGKVSKFPSFLVEGTIGDLKYEKGQIPKIFLGKDLAINMGAHPGSEITVVSPYGARGPFGVSPKMRKFIVTGIFDTGIYEYNSSMAYTSVGAAQDFFDMGGKISGISVAAAKKQDLDILAYRVQDELGFPYWARNWMNMNKSLFYSLQLERFAMFIILTLIIIVASFNIVSMISITVKDKRKDIAILRTVGASSHFITRVFMRQGLMVGLLGTVSGDALALIISLVLKNFKIISLPQDIYFMDKIPVNVDWEVYVLVTLCAITITFLAAIFPALQGAKTSPISALRND